MPEDITLFGRLESITPEGLATGWCWSPQQPSTHRSVNLVTDGRVVATVLCDQPRPALVTIGVGDGRHGFDVRIARSHFPPEAGTASVQMHDVQTNHPVGPPVIFSYPIAPSLSKLPVRLERVQEEGLVNGWCWDPENPQRRVALVVLVDGKPVGLTVADLYREDLKTSGIGDGAHAFAFLLPWEAIADKSVAHISVADRATGQVLPASTIFRRHVLRPVEQRLAELERQVRLLNARLDDASRRATHDAKRTAGLLATIGAFFTRLAESAEDEPLTTLVPSLPELLEHTRAELPPLSLRAPAEPVLTLVIAATGSIEAIHACLQAIHGSGVDALADVVVIDDGSVAAATLLPALVPTLRYWRVQPGQSGTQARNLVVQQARTGWVGFFSPAVRLTREWWDAAAATFERHPQCAALGAKLLREGGVIEAAYLVADAHGRLVDAAQGADGSDPGFDMLQPVAAVPDLALLVPAGPFRALGGFDNSLTDPGAAAVEYAIRAWENNHSVLYQPAVALRWDDPDGVLSTTHRLVEPGIMAWLARRWLSAARRAWPAPRGQALLIEGPDANAGWDTRPAIEAMQQLGWQVSFAVAGRLDSDDARTPELRALGVQVWRAPFQPSIIAGIERAGGAYGFIQIDAGALAAVPLDAVRRAAPSARIALVWNEAVPAESVLGAVEISDATIVRSARAAASLPAAKLRRFTARTTPVRFYDELMTGFGLPVAQPR